MRGVPPRPTTAAALPARNGPWYARGWCSSCVMGAGSAAAIAGVYACPGQRLIRALERPYQTFFKVRFEAHDGPRTMLVAQRVSQRASRQGSR
jgi:hypothetical protein